MAAGEEEEEGKKNLEMKSSHVLVSQVVAFILFLFLLDFVLFQRALVY